MASSFSTRTLPTDAPALLEAAVSEAVGLLCSGHLVALPTETVYGLAANAFDPAAVAEIFAVKERPAFDPLIVHLQHREWLPEVATVPEDIAAIVDKIAKALWPGPLTLILPKKESVSDLVTSGLKTVAVRVPAHPVFRRVLKACEFPLAAPSANRFGRISPTTATAVEKELGGLIPLILDAGACGEGLESTIIRVHPPEKTPKPVLEVLRAGPVTREILKPFGVVKKGDSSESVEAPGQMKSHYAPGTPLRLLQPDETFQPIDGRRYGLLSFSGLSEDVDPSTFAEVAVLSPGSGKLQEAAIRLFAMLRQLDEAGVDEIIAEPVPEQGLGVAIMDRLRKAAGQG